MLSARFVLRSKNIGPLGHQLVGRNPRMACVPVCWLVPRIGVFLFSDGLHGRCLSRTEGWASDKIQADCAEDGSETAIVAAARLSALHLETV